MGVRALIGVVLAAAAGAIGAAIGAVIGEGRRRDRHSRKLQAVIAPYLLRAGLPAEDVRRLGLFDEWKTVETGGDLVSGDIDGLDLCPCQHEYTVVENQIRFANRPAKAAIPGLLVYLPPAQPEFKCADDCVQVMTHRWRGWYLQTNGQVWILSCCQFAQWHCKKPTDPARDAPPIEGPPKPEA
jgi:hypothetical protein